MQTAQPDGKGMYDVPSAMDVAWMCMWPPLDYAPHPLMMSAGGMLMYLVDVSVSASVSAAVAAGSLLLRFILLACSAFVRSARNLEEYFRFLENLG